MKIFIFGRGVPSKKFPLNGIFEFDQACALKKFGLDVVYIAIDVRSFRRKRKYGISTFDINGLKIVEASFPIGSIPKKIRSFLVTKIIKKVYYKVCKTEGKPDIIHTHFLLQGYTIFNALASEKVKFIHTEHFSELNKKDLDEWHYKMGLEFYDKTDQVIVVSQALKNNLYKHFKIDSIVIPNIIDFNSFTESNYHFNNDEDYFNLISVGRLEAQKGYENLLEAFLIAHKRIGNIKLNIIGEGSLKKKIENWIIDNKLYDYVFLLGAMERKEIGQHFQKNDAFVLASQFETFGVVFAEAIASGLPVIGTICGGPEYFINESNGILVKKDNVKELSDAIVLMAKSYKEYNSKKISEDIQKLFSSDKFVEKVEGIYKDVTGKKNI